jgi:hypothetical protein
MNQRQRILHPRRINSAWQSSMIISRLLRHYRASLNEWGGGKECDVSDWIDILLQTTQIEGGYPKIEGEHYRSP